VSLIGRVPLLPALRQGGDDGVPIVVSQPDAPAGMALVEAARELWRRSRSKVGKPLTLMAGPAAAAQAGGHHH
jgi:ATP-binding protein involved in chromosome partitioning